MKRVLYVLGILFVFLFFSFGAFIVVQVYKDLKIEEALERELISIKESIEKDDVWDLSIDHKLNTSVTSDDYQIVENSIKNYLKDLLEVKRELDKIYNNERFSNLVNIPNVLKQDQELTATISFLKNFSSKIVEVEEELLELNHPDTIKKYLAKNTDEYYKDYFEKIMIDEDILKEIRDNIRLNTKESLNLVKNYTDLFEFLNKSKDNWQIEGSFIVFNDDNLKKEYDEYITVIHAYIIKTNQNIL